MKKVSSKSHIYVKKRQIYKKKQVYEKKSYNYETKVHPDLNTFFYDINNIQITEKLIKLNFNYWFDSRKSYKIENYLISIIS